VNTTHKHNSSSTTLTTARTKISCCTVLVFKKPNNQMWCSRRRSGVCSCGAFRAQSHALKNCARNGTVDVRGEFFLKAPSHHQRAHVWRRSNPIAACTSNLKANASHRCWH
jgi:hypothetical protein